MNAFAPLPMSGDWIVTAHGAEVDLRRPAPGALTAASIAHSLAQINRFTGHAARPYSVAEHSLLVVEICERELGITPATLAGAQCLLLALMHDAHECLCGDLHTPGKAVVGPAWRAFEGHLERAMLSAYALHTAKAQHGATVKHADTVALATERRDLMPPTPTPWAFLEGVEPVGWVSLHSQERYEMAWWEWRNRWLDRYHELDFARNALLPGASA